MFSDMCNEQLFSTHALSLLDLAAFYNFRLLANVSIPHQTYKCCNYTVLDLQR